MTDFCFENSNLATEESKPSKPKQNKKLKIQCSFCKKCYINIWPHLKKSLECQVLYDMTQVELEHKQLVREKNKQKNQKHRNARNEIQKKEDNTKDRRRKKENRDERTEQQKGEDNANDRKRKKENSDSRTQLQKEEDNAKDRKRKKGNRDSKDELQVR